MKLTHNPSKSTIFRRRITLLRMPVSRSRKFFTGRILIGKLRTAYGFYGINENDCARVCANDAFVNLNRLCDCAQKVKQKYAPGSTVYTPFFVQHVIKNDIILPKKCVIHIFKFYIPANIRNKATKNKYFASK